MSNLFDRMKLFVQRDKEFRSALYDIMGFYPHNVELYRIAFAHKSQEYKSHKTGDRPLNNERLEFLGDAVLETVVSDIVYHHFKTKREGFLTNTRSKIVSRESLGKLAKDLGIDRLIKSHISTNKSHHSFLAGNAFEALMGAIYLDRGFDYAFRFIEHRIMGSLLDLEGVAHKEVNFKSKLLEWSQKNRVKIDFKDKQASENGTAPNFTTTIVIEGLFAGDGRGFSKKEAHQNASKDALTRMRRESKFIDDVFTAKEKRTAMEADPCFVLPVIDEIEDDLAREVEQKEKKAEAKAKKSQAKQSKSTKPKQESSKSKQEPSKPKQELSKSKQEPSKSKQEPSKPKAEPKTDPISDSVPQVIPIAMETQPDPVPAVEAETQSVPANANAADSGSASDAGVSVSTVMSADAVMSTGTDASEEATAAVPAAKKSRRRGKRQNAAGFTNTDIIPAETSHRAEKAAAKVEEAKKEKARKQAKKQVRKAAKGIEVSQNAEADKGADSAAIQPVASQEGGKNAPVPRRRRKAKAELPTETPNPERDRAISAAEEAAYSQSNND